MFMTVVSAIPQLLAIFAIVVIARLLMYSYEHKDAFKGIENEGLREWVKLFSSSAVATVVVFAIARILS